ncbi:MAG: EAL domain-containing protein [Thauera sp.]|nr:EAL domain-containing protein [Thauera sp.]
MSGLGNELPGDVPVEPGQEGVQAAPRRASAALAELEARVARQAQMLSVLSALQRGMLVGRSSSDTFSAMLDHLLALTGSEYGFIGEVLHDEAGESFLRMHGLSDISWSPESRTLFERMRTGGFEFHNLDTLFGAVVRTAAPVICNAPAGDPRGAGLPPGHPELRAFLGLPLFHGGHLIGMVGLANAEQGYDQALIVELEPMLVTCASMIIALRTEEDRKTARRALEESERHFRELANSKSALIWTSDAEGGCNYFNDTWLQFTGRTLEQSRGTGWAADLHPDDAEGCLNTWRKAFARREPFRMEYRLRHADGGFRWISDEGNPRRDPDGTFLGYIGYCYDITERKRGDLALDALAARYARLSGEGFYEAVCRHVVEALDLDIAFVGQLCADGAHVEVRAGWGDGGVIRPFRYALAESPCDGTVGRGACIYPRGVHERFPRDRELVRMGIDAYAGVPLFDREGGVLGLMVALRRKPFDDEAAVRTLLEIFDDRVAAELVRERAERVLTGRIAFERLVGRISSELILAAPAELDGHLDQALGELGRFAEADRAYVFQVSEDGCQLDNTHEWCAEGIEPQIDKLQGLPFDDSLLFLRTIKQLGIVDYPSVAALPAEAEADRVLLEAQSIRSVLGVPMVVDGQVRGIIGLDAVCRERSWTDEDKTLMTLVGNAFSGVIERKRAHDGLLASEARYRSVVESVREVIFLLDGEGRWTFLNKAWADITGHPLEESLGRHFLAHVHADDREQHGEMVEQVLAGELESCTHAARYRCAGGGFRWLEMSARRALDAQGRVVGLSGTLTDITRQKEHESRLEYIAHYDALTGLPNRVLLSDRMQRGMAQARRRGQQLALAYIDLDGFKSINDTLGHQAGDQLLTVVAARMKAALREGDSISRLGGDEFVALLLDLPDVEACELLVRRLLCAVSQAVALAGQEVKVSASVGLTLYPQAEEVDADQLLRQADLAMYQAKLAGKNRYHVFDTAHDRSQRGRHQTLAAIRGGLRASEFQLLYQPKVNMRSGAVVGVEALIRWRHPRQGELEPAAFLPAVADHPLAVEIGDWVIEQALAQVAAWQRGGLFLPVSVNVGARHLQAADFMLRLQAALARHPELGPGALELEVLETSALESITQVTRIVEACAGIGVSFALDDFGTGYSSLAYLKRLPAARLKIDQLFVRGMVDDAEDLAILKAIMGLAHAFKREVVAEGVEEVEHGSLLLELGCEVAQGYGIARPMPAERIPAWAASWSPPAPWRLARA